MKKLTTIIILILLTLVQADLFAQGRSAFTLTYKNRAPQLLTDAVCAIHRRRLKLLELGTAASAGLAELAEDGDSSLLRDEFRNTPGVRRVMLGDFLSKSESLSINFRARRRDRITCVFGMLVASNDAFPAVFSMKLPRIRNALRRIRARVYDAGSEVNTESCSHVPGGPCNAHGIGIEENGTIERHPGILGIADLDPDQFGWRRIAVRGNILNRG